MFQIQIGESLQPLIDREKDTSTDDIKARTSSNIAQRGQTEEEINQRELDRGVMWCHEERNEQRDESSKEAYDTLMISPKQPNREQLSSIIMIASWSQTRMECWGGGQETAMKGTPVNSTPTAHYYKPISPPLKVRTVHLYWSGSRSSENRQVAWNQWHLLWTDK